MFSRKELQESHAEGGHHIAEYGQVRCEPSTVTGFPGIDRV